MALSPAIELLKNVSFLQFRNIDGSMEKMQKLVSVATKLGKSVRTLKLEFDGPDMQVV